MQSTLPTTVEALIEGDVTGQVAVGSYILQIGSVHGGVVNVAAPHERVVPRPRPSPVRLLPRRLRALFGREAEVALTTRALAEERPVEVSGAAGLGKTALLRHVAHHDAAAAPPDGTVYLSAHRQGAGDVLKLLWDAFYECDQPYVPTPATLRQALAEKRALVLLDDLSLDPQEVEAVLDAAPRCTFVWTSEARRGVGEVRTLGLKGLSPEAGIRLMADELGRDFTRAEVGEAHTAHEMLGGHPFRLLRAAALVRDEDLSFTEAAARVQAEHAS